MVFEKMKAKYKRLLSFLSIGFLLSIAFFWILEAFKTNLIYYVTPDDLSQKHIHKTIRVGGKVKLGSWDKLNKTFILGDHIQVIYKEMPPVLFRESQEAVVEGIYDGTKLIAQRIFAKHDENYFSKETVDKLKSLGQWKGKVTLEENSGVL
jgi:cytochrome c-type biogenesis protein CcmE